jgi:hypothetical protein
MISFGPQRRSPSNMASSSRLTSGNQGDHRESRPFPSTIRQGVHSDQDRHGPELSEHAVADMIRARISIVSAVFHCETGIAH